MPQLMPLVWVSYIFVFTILFFMMKGVYSVYTMGSNMFYSKDKKVSKDLWFW